MDPLPRLHPRLCLVPNCRFYKSSSPSRNWIMGTKIARTGLPPQYPYRRGSTTPISSLALTSCPPTPNRSRSLDGLLDSETQLAATKAAEETNEGEDNPSDKEKPTLDEAYDETEKQQQHTNLNKTKAHSMDDFLDCSVDNGELDKSSIHSNSSDSKRKRNFMDRCVNKVRSLIRK